MIARVRVLLPSSCNGGLWAAVRRRCHVNHGVTVQYRDLRSDVVNSFAAVFEQFVASTVWHVLKLSALRVARIWVAPVEEILVKEGRWKLSKA